MGIDYGLGRTNIDHKTGIRYGVISVNRLPYIWDIAEDEYGEWECECGHNFGENYSNGDECPECEREIDMSFAEPIGFSVDSEGVVGWIDSCNDLMITKSDYKIRGPYCSPCAPGAVSIGCNGDDDNWAYCPPPDWFDDDDRPEGIVKV